ncbi:hypothetical protein F2F61_07935 [Salmonella enterica]|nr:hypothetical protein [Salmonella enterica]
MSESVRTNTSIWSKGMLSVIVAQFLSAFGDNALLVGVPAVAIGIGFGVLFALAIAALWIWQRRQASY